MNKIPKIAFLILLISTSFLLKITAQNSNSKAKYESKIVENKNKTFGYQILKDTKVMINQESMPAVPGNDGFPRKIDAERMANLVIFKLENNIMPPTVTVAEVDSIKAIK